jgi:hypothetical protein
LLALSQHRPWFEELVALGELELLDVWAEAIPRLAVNAATAINAILVIYPPGADCVTSQSVLKQEWPVAVQSEPKQT